MKIIDITKRPEDRIMLWECVVVFGLLVVERIYFESENFEGWWVNYVYYIAPSLTEFLYMLAVLQWLVFVDYSLYRSMDHVRRRYKNAAIPIFVLMAADITQSIILFNTDLDDTVRFTTGNVFQLCKLAVELMYVLKAVRLVMVHEKESREPRFIRLSAFIIPFILGQVILPPGSLRA